MARTLLLISLCFAAAGWSQSTISAWQDQHPGILLMKENTFNNLSSSIRAQLDGNVILYKEVPTIADLEAFSSGEEKKMPLQNTATDEDGQYIKNWLGTHQQVKIVPRSVYNNSDPEAQQAYQSNYALVLAGEKITIADIQNYHP